MGGIVDLGKLDCSGCPALVLRDECLEWIRHCEELRESELSRMESVKYFILAESIPYRNFIYDLNTRSRLRSNLMREFNVGSPQELLNFLREKGVLIVDLALCPLHRLNKIYGKKAKSLRRRAATFCFEKHTYKYVELHPEAKIVLVVPSRCGLLKRSKAYNMIKDKIVAEFKFSRIDGLREIIGGCMNG